MQATFVHEAATVDYTPAADTPSGAVVVQGDLVGVAPLAIPANKLGSLRVTGVFDFVKAAGAGTAFTVGTSTFWDAGAGAATKNFAGGVNKLIGRAVRAAADGDTIVRVRLLQ